MPIIKFSGLDKEQVNQFSKNIQTIAELVKADPKNIFVICENSEIFVTEPDAKPIYVTVEWMSRPDKEQLLADFIVDYFKDYSQKVWVFFTDVNSKLYAHRKKLG
ncbi:DUF1904 family protein [Mycoplasma mycoides]|uniref:DUF1904 family protein n=1 Tax=Mycoplasma mycoides TaxID=2102 RepID=UPI0022404342|nr:DUF1904 family protein [Mycoplasma mycoides]MDP4040841.1 DUF1904 family protein [Mycoplasma mycoides]MDP4041715.1 DUF1904 family protein [Mycoplasma mycoides]MDP4042599.1 DUF1904 family protein [Mycoplasma mycoides]MDP4044076.1 DUF1904 family protein [Mycoplasma mycoides]MDP4044947.1 DUF1904 family protein [Mycoplasma mycoides]